MVAFPHLSTTCTLPFNKKSLSRLPRLHLATEVDEIKETFITLSYHSIIHFLIILFFPWRVIKQSSSSSSITLGSKEVNVQIHPLHPFPRGQHPKYHHKCHAQWISHDKDQSQSSTTVHFICIFHISLVKHLEQPSNTITHPMHKPLPTGVDESDHQKVVKRLKRVKRYILTINDTYLY